MKRITMALLGLLLCVGGLTAGPRVVFIGDSITRLWGSNNGAFFSDNDFSCKGADGQTTRNILLRFKTDVIDVAPVAVVIGAGTNDIAMNEDVFVSVEQIAANIATMVEMAQAAGIKVVLTSVMPSDYYWFATGVKPANIVPRLNNMLEQYAATHDCAWVDYNALFVNDIGKFDPDWSYDDCHPHPETYAIMEQAVMPVLEPILNQTK